MSSDQVATIKQLLSEGYGGLVMAHDAAGYAAQFAEDVLWAPPNAPDQTSVAGIENAIQGLFDQFSFQVNPRAEEVEVLGDLAQAIGSALDYSPGAAGLQSQMARKRAGDFTWEETTARTVHELELAPNMVYS